MKKQQNILHIIVLEVAHTFIGMYSVFNSTVPNALESEVYWNGIDHMLASVHIFKEVYL